MLSGLGDQLGFDVDTPWKKLPAKARKAILEGCDEQVHVRYRNRLRPNPFVLRRFRRRDGRSCSARWSRPTPSR